MKIFVIGSARPEFCFVLLVNSLQYPDCCCQDKLVNLGGKLCNKIISRKLSQMSHGRADSHDYPVH